MFANTVAAVLKDNNETKTNWAHLAAWQTTPPRRSLAAVCLSFASTRSQTFGASAPEKFSAALAEWMRSTRSDQTTELGNKEHHTRRVGDKSMEIPSVICPPMECLETHFLPFSKRTD